MRLILGMLFASGCFAKIPLYFEPNQGQAHTSVQFLSRGVFLNSASAAIVSNGKTMTFRLERANAKARAEALDALPGVSNYYLGNDPKKWRTDIPHFARIRYYDVYPGIDVIYYSNAEGKLEYDFIVQPGANPNQIQIAFNEPVHTTSEGDLLIAGVRQHRPKVYQAGHNIECSYVVGRGRQIELALSHYDRAAPLTIDPVIEYSTYLGGNAYDVATAVTVDGTGAAYITGYLKSPNYPSLDPFQQTSGIGQDIFVAKFTPSGNALAWYTYIGGSALDSDQAIALDGAGNVYVTGWTASNDFPVKGAAQSVFAGGYENAIIVKLSSAGKLVYSTYLGGNNQERALGLAVDSTGAAFIAGFTWSADFPVKNALQPTMTGRPDAFVAKLSPAGDRFLFATYLGGSGIDYGEALTLDPSGNPIVVGLTLSPDYPIVGGLQMALGGFGIYPTNGFITKLSSSGDRILSSTYLGASGSGGLFTVTTDRTGQVYVSGRVSSDGWPLKNPIQSAYGGGQADLYIAKLTPALDSLVYGTYLGGSADDYTGGLAVDNAGNAYVTGSTYSSDFPLKNSLQSFLGATVGFKTDAFIVKIAANGSLIYSTLLGGHGGDHGWGIAVDSQTKVYIAGGTTSEDFPVKNPLQSTYGGGEGDIFLVRFTPEAAAVSPFMVTPATLLFRYVAGASLPVPQIVLVASSSTSAFAPTPTSSASWLKFTASGTTTPATLSVTTDPTNLKAGVYSGAIQIDAQTSVQVTLNVLDPGPIVNSISPSTIPIGSNAVILTVNGSGFKPGVSVQLNGSAGLSATLVDSGTLQIALDKGSFTQAGTLSFVVVNPQSAPSQPLQVTIGTPPLAVSAVTNAASYGTGAVAPGEIISLFGTGLAPTAGVPLAVTSAGLVSTILSGVQVLFDGIPAPLIYARADQVSAIVPYVIGDGRANTRVLVQYNGQTSAVFTLPVAGSAPALFTADASGRGQGAILNEDGSVNSLFNPAAKGSVVVLYGTGEGVTNPPGVDGKLAGDVLPKPKLPVAVSIDGKDAQILYAGAAPGEVAGVIQVNVVLPQGVISGAVPIVLRMGAASSQAGVILSVQ